MPLAPCPHRPPRGPGGAALQLPTNTIQRVHTKKLPSIIFLMQLYCNALQLVQLNVSKCTTASQRMSLTPFP